MMVLTLIKIDVFITNTYTHAHTHTHTHTHARTHAHTHTIQPGTICTAQCMPVIIVVTHPHSLSFTIISFMLCICIVYMIHTYIIYCAIV